MSLAEVMTGSLLFCLAAAASLQVWGRATVAVADQEQRQHHLDQADASLLRAEEDLRRLAASSPGGGAGDCSEAAARLALALAAEPVAPGMVRRLQRPEGGDRVLVSLMVSGEKEPRQRLYVPAALGGCGAPAAAPAPDPAAAPASPVAGHVAP